MPSGAMVLRQEGLLLGVLLPELKRHGIEVVDWVELELVDRHELSEVFERRIFPVLTPLAVDPAHPFPYISNLALSLAAMVSDPDTGERRFARVKVPTVFPRLIALSDGVRHVPVEQVIAAHLHLLFSGMVVEECAVFRVTRNADLTLEDEDADDLLAAVELELRRRRFGRAVRLEAQAGMSAEMVELLVRELDLETADVSFHATLLDLTCMFQLAGLDRPELKDAPWPPVTAGRIVAADEAERSIFSVIRERPLLVHHPYESFASSIESFIAQAADDPKVQSIKMTMYRAGGDSPIARSLIRAAERGVQVAVLVELKARFDEATNVNWAKTLERAGVHVVYGLVGLKTHAKCVLVVRNDDDGLRRYCHVGTGNYNSKTARLYEDVGFITLRPRHRRRRHPAVQPPHGLQPHARVPQLAGGATRDAQPVARPHRPRGRPRHRGCDHGEAELAGRPAAHRGALRGQPRRGVDRSAHSRHLLPGARRAGDERDDQGAIAARSLPRALAHHVVRPRRSLGHGASVRGTPPSRCTSSVRPTGCSATSIVASRCSCRSAIPSTRCGSTTCSSSCCAAIRCAGSSTPRASGTGVAPSSSRRATPRSASTAGSPTASVADRSPGRPRSNRPISGPFVVPSVAVHLSFT